MFQSDEVGGYKEWWKLGSEPKLGNFDIVLCLEGFAFSYSVKPPWRYIEKHIETALAAARSSIDQPMPRVFYPNPEPPYR
jgi:hypothetical protein